MATRYARELRQDCINRSRVFRRDNVAVDLPMDDGLKAAAAAWAVRTIGPADGSAGPDLDDMLASMRVTE